MPARREVCTSETIVRKRPGWIWLTVLLLSLVAAEGAAQPRDTEAEQLRVRSVTLDGVESVDAIRGTYEFQGRRFDVLRDGQVRFPGLAEINPLIDITARRTISSVQADIHIGGTLQQPALTLSSQPPLDEADILSLIVFNQPANQLGTAEQVSLGQRATALASGFVASQLAESIGGALQLDILEIETGGSVGSSAGVTVGEQLGERLFLRVRQGFGAAGATPLMIEYEFTDWLRLQSTVSGEQGGSESLFQRSERSGVNWK